MKRVLAEAHDSAIILINPTDADKFLRVRIERRKKNTHTHTAELYCSSLAPRTTVLGWLGWCCGWGLGWVR